MADYSDVFPPKDPADRVWYEADWADWLDVGDALSTISWTVPSGVTKHAEQLSGTKARLDLSGGTANTDYDCVCQVTTANARIGERTYRVPVRSL